MFGAGTSRHRKTIEAREIQGTLEASREEEEDEEDDEEEEEEEEEDPLYLQLMVVVVVEHQPIIRDRCARRHATEQSLLEVRHLSPPTPQHQTHCSANPTPLDPPHGPQCRPILEKPTTAMTTQNKLKAKCVKIPSK
ncbi:unnamed protein product [Prorocentrum cordatum]|uniref:Uncharacterized protein n=1 Tax=Prorocentrum cordatum TaxID=2364126 RepID=A0ABN9SS93_9DINO|nr:unnamed protein product [Polarella glacialis]